MKNIDDLLGFIMIFSFLIGSAGAECVPVLVGCYTVSAAIALYFYIKEGKHHA